jgi:CheY-like chemotaxis protein
LVQELVHLLQVSLSKKVRLSCQLAEDLPTIEGDAAQLRQVVMNLVINAAEAVGDTEGVIVVSTGVMQCDEEFLRGAGSVASLVPPPPGRYVCLEITDTGCGMDAETLARIFDPFFTTKFAGRGLGLAAVLGIVRQHKGMLKVQSERGKGTAFRVLFPASGKTIPPATPDAAPPSWRGTGTVLLVDDEEPVRRVASKMLERCGFRVLTAGDGREAVDLFRQDSGEIVCVLLDLAMPCMNGEETFRELRRLQPGVRIILASGYSDSEVLGRFADGGLAASIEKPYELPALNALLQKVLTQPGPAGGTVS